MVNLSLLGEQYIVLGNSSTITLMNPKDGSIVTSIDGVPYHSLCTYGAGSCKYKCDCFLHVFLFIWLLFHFPAGQCGDVRNHAACYLDMTLIVRVPACSQVILVVVCEL